jgi:heme-degrading monooxygenase HmoA
MTSCLTVAVYRPRPGREGEVLPHLRREIATIRARGYFTSRPAVICRTHADDYLVITEWATEESVDAAQADDVVVELWRRKERLVEYLAPSEVDGAEILFPSFEVIEDA